MDNIVFNIIDAPHFAQHFGRRIIGDDGGAPVGGQHGRSPDKHIGRHAKHKHNNYTRIILFVG